MALGYEGYVSLTVDTIEDVAMCTGGGFPENRQRLESSSGYGGKINNTPSTSKNAGIALPRTYDWSLLDGNFSLEMHKDFLTNQLKPWLFDRQTSATECYIKTRKDNAQIFDRVYWNNIGFSASEGGLLEASLGMVAIDRDSYTIGGDYIGNKQGSPALCSTPPPYPADPLNPGATNINPIPYWNTKVLINGNLVTFTSWSLDFSQEVVKFFACEHNANPVEPKYLAVGPMTISFSGDYMFVAAATFLSPDTLTSLYVYMGGEVLKLEDLDLQTDSDLITGADSIVPVVIEYAAYSLVA